MLKRRILFSILSLVVAVAPAMAFADFNPNKIIDDRNFSDTQTFGSAAGIQLFLQSKNSPLANIDPNFLLMLKEPQDSGIKTGLGDPEPSLGRLRTAAELIWDASQKTGINPQVIIVTLQKEQSLINGNFSGSQLQRALDHALGFGCPDSGGCDSTFVGFYAQMFGGFDGQGNRYIGAPGSLMRSFNTAGGRGPAVDANGNAFGSTIRTSHVGDTITLQNTMGNPNAQPTQTITLQDSATAALYRYTPHVYNGNYNFWKFYDQWFRYPNGTLLRLQGDNNTYIVNNGLKSLIPNFVITARNLNPNSAITVSPTELSSIDPGPLYGPTDNTVIKDASGKLFVFENSEKHPVSAFVLSQRGLNAANAIGVAQNEADMFATAALLAPKEGTMIQGANSKTVYVIQNQQRMILSGFTFKQYGYSFKNVAHLPQDEVDQYAGGTDFLLPKDGTLVKMIGSDRVYLLQNGMLHPISATVFKLRGYRNASVAILDSGELTAANVDGYVAPPEGTYFRTPDGAIYLYKGGTKHPLTAFVFKQRRPGYVNLSSNEANDITDGMPLAPKDGTLIKGDQSGTIFVIQKGMKVALDYNTWVRKYRKQKPTVLSQAEVDSYPAPGDIQQ